MPQNSQNTSNLKQIILLIVVVLLLGGLFYLSLIDGEYRPIFADLAKDLAKMGFGAYLAWMIK